MIRFTSNKESGTTRCTICGGLISVELTHTGDNYCKGHMKYYHELPQSEIDKHISDKKTYQFIVDNYKQPEWCKYPDALNGSMGCWSLIDNGLRPKISKEFCANCDQFNTKIDENSKI